MARTSRKQSAAQTAAPEVKAEIWNAAPYVRLSVLDNGKKDGESILNQQEMLERYIAEHPELALKRVFVEM